MHRTEQNLEPELGTEQDAGSWPGRAGYFFAAFEGARDAMAILDDERHYVDANPAACQLLGLGAGELIGRRLDDFTPPEHRPMLDQWWASFLLAGHEAGENELLRDDGARVAVEYTFTAHVAPGRHLSAARSVTERRAADEMLERQRRLLTEAQSVGGFGSFEYDVLTGAVEWSDELYRIYGIDPATAIDFEEVHRYTHPDDCAALEDMLRRPRAGHESFRYEYRIIRPDGTTRVIELRAEAVAGDDGALLRMFGTGQDITERRNAEMDRHNLSTILDGSDDAISACSLDGVLISWNRGAEQLYGYTAQEAIGQHVSMLLPPEERAADQTRWKRTVSGEHIDAFESVRITKDGRGVDVAVTLSPIIDAGGAIIGVAAIGRDVTTHKQTLVALAETSAKAVQASRLKSQFMANMNHELRTPLNGVIGISSLLLATSLSEAQQEYVEALRVSGDALMAVIEDILDFSKIEAGKLELVSEAFELRTLVEDVTSMVAVSQPTRGVEVISSIEADLPACVWGDANRVRQVLTNLTNNAVKFTEAGEVEIYVTGRQETDDEVHLRVEVRDTGIGIDAGKQDSIFESFAQADGSSTRRYGGTGLGLTIAKQLVTMMGGEIGVRSTPGEGSTFWFTLPLRIAQSEPPPAAHRALRDVRVLVVDDKATNRAILERQLGAWGMAAHTVADGASALAELTDAARSGTPYRVALLDFKMALGNMTGGELALAIKAYPALDTLTVVMMVAARDAETAAAVVEVDRVVTKPLRQSRLYDEIVQVLGGGSPARPPAAVPEQAMAGTRSAAGRRILVAEDNAVNQLVAVRLLQLRGFEVDVAANGREALEMHQRTAYDAIFMDCQMPELDGYETTGEIRRRESGGMRHTPIIAMTASTMPGDTERCLAAGMDYYSGKPINTASLDRVLAQALGPPG